MEDLNNLVSFLIYYYIQVVSSMLSVLRPFLEVVKEGRIFRQGFYQTYNKSPFGWAQNDDHFWSI